MPKRRGPRPAALEQPRVLDPDCPMPPLHFVVFVLVTLLVFVAILRFVLRDRPIKPSSGRIAVVAFVVVVVGMGFAKWGANSGLVWFVYYGVPAAVTVVLPPLALRMRQREVMWYLALALVSSPAIHAFFSLFVGWHEYMPFWRIPSLWPLTRP